MDAHHEPANDAPKGMSMGSAIIGMLLTAIGGFLLGNMVTKGGGGSGADTEISVIPAGAVDTSVERFKVPLPQNQAMIKGSPSAKVTIIEYSDFQCPFCSRVVGTMEQIEKAYGKDVRVAFKNNPLPFHPNAGPAAEAALAAADQNRFWDMHDKLFKNQQNLTPADFDKYAGDLGLNPGKFKDSITSGKNKASIQADTAEAAKFGARGTPSFFINGRPLSGAQPFEQFKKIIDEEIAAANKAIKAGVKPEQVYAALTKEAKTGTAAPDAQQPAAQAQRPSPPPADNQVYRVPVGNSPARGPANAPVTIVQFSDFQCPFCSRVEETITQVEKEYGSKVRVVWKNNPLPFHPNAMPAAEAAMAANDQGKFWALHDAMFKNQQALDRPTIEKEAGEAGVKMDKFKASWDAAKHKKEIESDMALAAQLGARGTPSFFINGKPLRGAQPFPSFKAAIDAALADAEAAAKRGVKPADMYAELTKNGLDKQAAQPAPGAPPTAAPNAPPADTVVYKALLGDAPVKGSKNAKVTIVEFSDFQCPFCSRVEPTVDQVMKAYPNDVRVAFKQLPLPFHDKAHLAAEAALAAKEQGKFWEMHGKLFANQQALDRPNLEKYAGEIGLNMGKFKEALDSGKWKAKVDAELAEGNKIGARGTPSFFVNGKAFVGAQPFESFKAKIDEEIKNADAVAKAKHVSGAKIYDEIMKDAKTEVAAAPAQPTAPGGAQQADTTIYKVDGGGGPSRGPAGAPVQIVMFSDFQCPFCSRVEPTVKQIMDKYNGKVRITWRNYPLPFHQNAMPAAEAAMAAAEQGKFWEMHDKLFANQQTLDRATYERHAQEIGLDMGKFKSALDSGKLKEKINADVTYANGLPGGGMGTPTFFINGHKLSGAYPFDEFAKIIDGELKKKG